MNLFQEDISFLSKNINKRIEKNVNDQQIFLLMLV